MIIFRMLSRMLLGVNLLVSIYLIDYNINNDLLLIGKNILLLIGYNTINSPTDKRQNYN